MDHAANTFLSSALNKRTEQNTLRSLVPQTNLVDFCSNDYLGFSRSEKLKNCIERSHYQINGSTGSRLLSGNTSFTEEVEKQVAQFHRSEAGLIFNSGYDANIGLFSCVPQRGDTIIYDELVHASIHDGIKLSPAGSFMFRHNNLEHLEQRLTQAKGIIYVAVESIYSMDGDAAPLKKINDLCKKYHANLIVDEAHATGVIGEDGKGMVCELQLEKEIFARVYTFGKAIGCHGAIVLGSELLRNYLVNFSRSFIYSTALPPHSIHAVSCAYHLLSKEKYLIKKLHMLIRYFKSNIHHKGLIESDSPVQCIVVEGNDKVKELSALIQKSGFDVRPILSPTVPKGKERIRICLHAFNTEKELAELIKNLNKLT